MGTDHHRGYYIPGLYYIILPSLQVPSALLTFSWDASVLEDIRAAGAEPAKSVLRPELLAAIEQLS